jgi:hypothetical protein
MTSVLMNLVGNAIKYADPRKPAPQVEVGARVYRRSLLLYVQDNGIGIAREELPRILRKVRARVERQLHHRERTRAAHRARDRDRPRRPRPRAQQAGRGHDRPPALRRRSPARGRSPAGVGLGLAGPAAQTRPT